MILLLTKDLIMHHANESISSGSKLILTSGVSYSMPTSRGEGQQLTTNGAGVVWADAGISGDITAVVAGDGLLEEPQLVVQQH